MFMIAIAALAVVQGPGPVTQRQLSDARSAFDERLFDYPSARFRETYGNGFLICGKVNAKNRLGAFIGWKRFALFAKRDDEPATLYVEDTDSSADVMLEICDASASNTAGRDWSPEITYRR